MEILVYIALAVVVVTLFGALRLAPTSSLGFCPLLSGYTVIIYTMIIYVALSASIPIFFNDMVSYWYPGYSRPETFFWTLVVCWLGIAMFVGFYHFFTRSRPSHLTVPRIMRADKGYFPLSAYLLVCIGTLMKVIYVVHVGGLHHVMVMRSGGISEMLGYDRTDTLDTDLLYLSMTADAAACWLLLEAMNCRRQILFHSALAIVVLAGTLVVTPKREYLMMPALAILVGFSIYVRPLRLSHAPVFLIGAVGLSLLTLLGRIVIPVYEAGLRIVDFARWDLIQKFAVRLMSADTNLFDATVVTVYGRDDIIAKFGGWWEAFYRPNIEPFSFAIPRVLWPTKPDLLVDVSTALRAIERGLTLESVDGGNGVGLIGTSWLYGEFIGLACGMALLAWAASYVDSFLNKMHYASAGRILVFAISLATLFQAYRQATLGWSFLDFFQTLGVFWLTNLFLTYLANSRPTLHLHATSSQST
jgi:hypothetical protein